MTAQIHERLILDGDPTTMACSPGLPSRHPRLKELTQKEINDGADMLPRAVFTTGCWRRYLGTWEIKDGQLFLLAVAGTYRLEGEEPLFADWFTGVLRVPRGKILKYVHMGFATIFEEELHIDVARGRVTGTSIVDNRGRDLDDRKQGSKDHKRGWLSALFSKREK